jgi:uncharacterized membrane protein
MNITKLFGVYLACLVTFFALDLTWIGVVAHQFYQSQIGGLLKPQPNWPAAMVFYALYLVGIIVFAVLPNHTKSTVWPTLIYGAAFGFFCYATYDLTNLAVTKDWPLAITIVDLIWGTVLTGTVAAAGYFAAQLLGL